MTEERILDFLDGNLSSHEEEELLHRLAVSPERRSLLKQHLQVRELTSSLARRQFVTVPIAVTNLDDMSHKSYKTYRTYETYKTHKTQANEERISVESPQNLPVALPITFVEAKPLPISTVQVGMPSRNPFDRIYSASEED